MNIKHYVVMVFWVSAHLYAGEALDSFSKNAFIALWFNDSEISSLLKQRLDSACLTTSLEAPVIAACAQSVHGKRLLSCLGFGASDEYRQPIIRGMPDNPFEQQVIRYLMANEIILKDSVAHALWSADQQKLAHAIAGNIVGQIAFCSCGRKPEPDAGQALKDLLTSKLKPATSILPIIATLAHDAVGKKILSIFGFSELESSEIFPHIPGMTDEPLRRRVIQHLLSPESVDLADSLKKRIALALWVHNKSALFLALAHHRQGRNLLISWGYEILEKMVVQKDGITTADINFNGSV